MRWLMVMVKDREAWRAAVSGVAKSQARLSERLKNNRLPGQQHTDLGEQAHL